MPRRHRAAAGARPAARRPARAGAAARRDDGVGALRARRATPPLPGLLGGGASRGGAGRRGGGRHGAAGRRRAAAAAVPPPPPVSPSRRRRSLSRCPPPCRRRRRHPPSCPPPPPPPAAAPCPPAGAREEVDPTRSSDEEDDEDPPPPPPQRARCSAAAATAAASRAAAAAARSAATASGVRSRGRRARPRRVSRNRTPAPAAAAAADDDDDDDLEITGRHNPAQLPHARDACESCCHGSIPPPHGWSRRVDGSFFHQRRQRESDGAHQARCASCFCFVCEVPAAECGSWADACDGACDGADGCRSHCHATAADPLWKAAKEERRAASRLDDLVVAALCHGDPWWTTPVDSDGACPMCLAPLSEKASADEEYEYESDGDDGLVQVERSPVVAWRRSRSDRDAITRATPSTLAAPGLARGDSSRTTPSRRCGRCRSSPAKAPAAGWRSTGGARRATAAAQRRGARVQSVASGCGKATSTWHAILPTYQTRRFGVAGAVRRRAGDVDLHVEPPLHLPHEARPVLARGHADPLRRAAPAAFATCSAAFRAPHFVRTSISPEIDERRSSVPSAAATAPSAPPSARSARRRRRPPSTASRAAPAALRATRRRRTATDRDSIPPPPGEVGVWLLEPRVADADEERVVHQAVGGEEKRRRRPARRSLRAPTRARGAAAAPGLSLSTAPSSAGPPPPDAAAERRRSSP